MNTLKCVACEIEMESEDFTVKCPICNGVMVKKKEYKRARQEYTLAVLEPKGYTDRPRLEEE